MNDQAPVGTLVSPLASAHAFPPPALSIVVPTFREATNVNLLIDAISTALSFDAWEIIFVDDNSDDETWRIVRERGRSDSRIRCIRRFGRRGLAGAIIDGFSAASANILAAMDCDLQHDEELLSSMLMDIRRGSDLVVATRYAPGATAAGGLTTGWRQRASRYANRLANILLGVEISDPMSGFFMIRRSVFEVVAPKLSNNGFKILLDILASSPAKLKISQIPYTFRPRKSGESKLGELVIVEFCALLAAKMTRDRISPRFLLFAFVGITGIAVHLVALRAALAASTLTFSSAQVFAAYAAMTSNFWLNNRLTYRDRRLSGAAALRGLLSFYLVCSIGTIANVGVARMLYDGTDWWQAGIAGALMAAVFNYAASAIFTWRT